MTCCIGFDVGGTHLKAALVRRRGRVVTERSAPTPTDKGADGVIDAMVDLVRTVVEAGSITIDQVAGIGVGAPGAIDVHAGVVLGAPNLPGWVNLPLGDRLRERTGRPVVVANDANVAAFAEYRVGVGRDPSVKDLVMIVLGTGVGSGIVLDGRILHGGFGMAGEIGHTIIEPNGRACGCGQRGCLECYVSATGVARRAIEAIEAGERSSLRATCDEQGGQLSSQDVFDAVVAADALACRIADETADYLGICCVNLSRLLDPQMIVLAGGLAQAGDPLFSRVRAAYATHNWTLVPGRVRIVPAQLGIRAGIVGAAALAWDSVDGAAETH